MWLKVATTNNNPKVIGHYYLNCVESIGGKGLFSQKFLVNVHLSRLPSNCKV